MNLVSYAQSIHDLSILKDKNIDEVIISSKSLSRFARTDDLEVVALLGEAQKMDFKVVLEWDVLITESDFSAFSDFFSAIPSDLYDVIRVQDAGVLEYCLTNSTKPIQYILETGNHNLRGIETWVCYIGDRLDRIVLSSELSRETLSEYIKTLSCKVEVLVLGRILLFYSPRKLLSVIGPSEDEPNLRPLTNLDYIEAVGESEESPHKGFPLVENKHGTFMFHIKDLCLLDQLETLENLGLGFARFDLRFQDSLDLVESIFDLKDKKIDFSTFKSLYPADVIKGYFNINKSDVLFKKLKNYRIQRKDHSYVGEVLEAAKGKYLAVELRSNKSIKSDDMLKIITPEGVELSLKVHELYNVKMEPQSEVNNKGELVFINYMRGVWSKSQVYLA